MPQRCRPAHTRPGPLSGLILALCLTACAQSTSGRGTALTETPATTSATRPVPTAGQCAYPSHGSAARDVGVPPSTDLAAPRSLVLQVTIGARKSPATIVVALVASHAPCTVNSIAFLATAGFYDRTPCHGLTTAGIFVLRCGDPTGTGSGGPGYTFADELVGGERYSAGVVAMANAGPDTNGSQFFIVYRDSPTLPPAYVIFGAVVSGLDVVAKLAAGGTDGSSGNAGDGHPKVPLEIVHATAL